MADDRPRAELLAEIHALHGILASQAVIERAKGVLMLSHGLTTDAAFDLLRWYSQQHNIKVRDLATQLVNALAEHAAAPVARDRVDWLLSDLTADG